jgi:hypothetical protein
MFTTGSKLLIGSAALAWFSAAAYGVAQEGALGTIGLISVAVALSMLAGLDIFVRDANVDATEAESFVAAPAAQATARRSLWPLLVAIGATMVALGLATLPTVFILGIAVIVAGTVEWVLSSWSERASADPVYNEEVRDVFADPLQLPVAGAILFAIIVYTFSRVMLGVPTKTAAVVAFAVLGALALAIGFFVAMRRGVSAAAVTGLCSVGVVALVAGGAAYGFAGEREIEEHETTADIAEHDECGAEETHADDRASQTVAAKSNVTAELLFDGSALEINAAGQDASYDTLTLPRSNPNNILFRNDSDHEARLVIDLFPAEDEDGEPVGPQRLCTALVEEGGTQFLTVEIDRPSYALADGETYAFIVAGTDAAVEVVVP